MLSAQQIEFNDFNALKILDLTYSRPSNRPYPVLT